MNLFTLVLQPYCMTGSWLGRIEGLSLFVGNKEVTSYINCLTYAMYAKHLSCMTSYADIGDLKSC